MRRHSIPKARFAAILALLVVSGAVALLVACPPAAQTPPVQAPKQTSPVVQQPETPQPVRQQPAAHPEHLQPEASGMLAVIIDDAGYSLEELKPFLALSGPLTVAVLPNLPHSGDAARMVLAAGKDLILHCPMEATGGEDPGPGALRTDQSPEVIESLLAKAFASVPGARGMNNHMGSKATADPALMKVVLGYLKKEGKFYIDSRTTADTVGPRVAAELGVPCVQRDVFIDATTSPDDIAAAFSKGVAEAETRGSAVMIGHVQNRGVLAILREREQDLAGRDVRLAHLAEVMQDRERVGLRVEDSGDRKLVR